jgi:hypothetical protein
MGSRSRLSRAGLKIAVVERNPRIGGGCKNEEPTLPVYRFNLHSNFFMGLRHSPLLHDLELYRFGFSYIELPIQQGAAFRTCVVTLRPSVKALVYDVPIAKTRGQITPRDSRSISVKNRINEQPVVCCITAHMTFSPGRRSLIRSHWSSRNPKRCMVDLRKADCP